MSLDAFRFSQEQLFPITLPEEVVAKYGEFLVAELIDAKLTALEGYVPENEFFIEDEEDVDSVLELLSIAAEGIAQELAAQGDFADPADSRLLSESIFSRIVPKGIPHSEDPFIFDVDHGSEFAFHGMTFQEFATALTGRAERMARTVLEEIRVLEAVK